MRRDHSGFPPAFLSAAMFRVSVLALTGLAASAVTARAGQDPVVIPGLTPAQMARPVAPAEPSPGAYGGGFIEFLVTGNSGIVTGDSGRGQKSVSFDQNRRSRSVGTTGHVQTESAVNLVRNTQFRKLWKRSPAIRTVSRACVLGILDEPI